MVFSSAVDGTQHLLKYFMASPQIFGMLFQLCAINFVVHGVEEKLYHMYFSSLPFVFGGLRGDETKKHKYMR